MYRDRGAVALMADVRVLEPDTQQERRALVIALGTAIRELGEAFVGSEVSDAVLSETLATVRAATAALGVVQREVDEPPVVDDLARRIRVFNPVTGGASPLAPPMRFASPSDDGAGCVGRVVLGLAHEGPFTYAHGGVTAALLDDILGRVASSVVQPVVTSTLSIRYRAPVPLRVPLVVTGTVTASEGSRFTLRGTVVAESAPATVLAEAEGRFVALSSEQATALFGRPDLHDIA